MSFIESQKALLIRHKNRLAVVRELKAKASLELFGKQEVWFISIDFLCVNESYWRKESKFVSDVIPTITET